MVPQRGGEASRDTTVAPAAGAGCKARVYGPFRFRGREARDISLVYHFTTLHAAVEHILPSGMVRFGEISNTNDLRESEPWALSIGGVGHDLPDQERLDAAWKTWRRITSHSKLFCCSSEDHPDSASSPVPGYDHMRMWAQYADTHRGVCLAFDRDALIRAAEAHGRVISDHVGYESSVAAMGASLNLDYGHDRNSVTAARVISHVEEHAANLFFTKTPDWRDELEWRCALLTEKAGPVLIDAASALRGVILGHHAWRYAPTFRKLVQHYDGVDIKVVRWMPHEGRLQLQEPPN